MAFRRIAAFALVGTILSTGGAASWEMCKGPVRVNCLVDGDTIWIDGKKLRMLGYDTPEPSTHLCGGAGEIALSHKASQRVLDLLNSEAWTVEYSGVNDDTGTRELITIWIGGVDLGDILIRGHLAREWPDGEEYGVVPRG